METVMMTRKSKVLIKLAIIWTPIALLLIIGADAWKH